MKSGKSKRPTAGRAASTVIATPPTHPSYFWPLIIGSFVALCAVFTVYGPGLNGPFLLDDDYLPYTLPGFSNLPVTAWIKGNRPLLMVSYWLNFQMSGANTSSYHFFNVALHLLNGVWIYLAVRKILEWAGTVKWTRELTAAFAAGLFLLHPLQTESVTYIASRSETLSVFFFLAAFVTFLYALPSACLARTAGVLVLFGAAVLSKEHTVVLPLLLLLTDYYWNPGFSFAGVRRNAKLYITITVLGAAGGLFILRVLRSATTAGFHVAGISWYQYFFTECRVIWKYILLYVFPFGQNLDPDVAISRSLLDHGAVFGMLGLLGVSVAAWLYRRQFPVASYGWFVFLLLLAPTSSFVPIADPYAERRLYLPFIGLLLITAEFLRRWKASRSVVIGVLCAVLVFEACLTYNRNELYSSAIPIWQETASKSPNKRRPNYQYAFALFAAGRCPEAVKEFAHTASIESPSYDLLLDWGLAASCAGDRELALIKLRGAAALAPNANVLSTLGLEYLKQGKYAEALDTLNSAIRIDSRLAIAYLYRGKVYELQGDTAAALKDYQRAVELDPTNPEATAALQQVAH
jgi:tetratricopeptide (TPR) repeat protein